MSYYRFLNNHKVTETQIVAGMKGRTKENVKDKSVLVLVDTSEFNCEFYNNRILNDEGLGMLSDNQSLGFLMHPQYVLDETSKTPLGIADVKTWCRKNKITKHRKKRIISEKESDKWYSNLINTRDNVLEEANHVTYVMDREADIYEVLAEVPKGKTDIVIRSNHNRRLIKEDGKVIKLRRLLEQTDSCGQTKFYCKTKEGRNREIQGNVKYTKAKVLRPSNMVNEKGYPKSVAINIVEVKEKKKGGEKIHWIILTTREIASVEQALEIIEIYRVRWQIEELFRLMKKESFDIESSELGSGMAIRKLALFVMEAALKVQQLKTARNGDSILLTDDVFTKEEVETLRGLNVNLCGNTKKLTNPFMEVNLAWATWVIARLGGWSGYQKQRPPGPLTLKWGLEKFEIILYGQRVLKDMYKP